MERTLSESSDSDVEERPSFGSNSFSDLHKYPVQPPAGGKRRRDESAPPNAGAQEEPVPKKSRANVAQAIMEKFGWEDGRGLGKNEQGRREPVQAAQQKGRRGLGLLNQDLADAGLRWVPEDEIVTVKEDMTWISTPDQAPPTTNDLHDWMGRGARKETIDDETLFCSPETLDNVLSSKTIFDTLDRNEMHRARTRSNPFETIRGAFFLNRAAVKMANIDKACDFMFTKTNDNENLFFADVCAGPGGFSEYVLWRRQWHAKGFGFTLKDSNDFKLDDFYAGPPETFHPFYGPKEDGNVYDPANQAAFRQVIMQHTRGQGVHFMMADGGFSVEGKENIQEILSKQLYLCQCLVALNIVREGGHFVTKLFDLFTQFSVGLVYLMYRCFDRVSIFKPNTSRPANSERYLICQGRKAGVSDIIQYLSEANDYLSNPNLLDVTELVPLELLQDDDLFYNYIFDSNNTLGTKQVVGLLKIAAYCEDATLFEERQPQMRKECLEYWDLPDQSRVVPKHSKPEDKLMSMVRSSTRNVMGKPPRFLTATNVESTVLNTPCDWYSVVCGTMSGTSNKEQDLAFYFGMGRTKVFKWKNGVWKRVGNIELPPDTLVYAELVEEMRGEHKMMRRSPALHIIDAYFLGGEEISQKPLPKRHALIKQFCLNAWKINHGSYIPVRFKELLAVDQNLASKLRVHPCTLKNGTETYAYHIDESLYPRKDNVETEKPFIIPNNIMFLKNTSAPWQRLLSRSTGFHYYFHPKTNESLFDHDRPVSSYACFTESFVNRIEWHWLQERSFPIKYLYEKIQEKCPASSPKRSDTR